MEISYWKDQKVIDNPHGLDARRLYSHENAEIMQIILQSGENVIPHKTPVDVVFYIAEGTVEVTIANESEIVRRDAIIHSPANVEHSIQNQSSGNARIVVIKTPNPNKM